MTKRSFNRVLHAILFTLLTPLGVAFLACGYFVLSQVEAPHPDVIPTILWVTCFAIMLLFGIAMSFYCILRALDEIFYDQSNTRRITGTRPAPRVYTTRWQGKTIQHP
jgi:hypothetical protein